MAKSVSHYAISFPGCKSSKKGVIHYVISLQAAKVAIEKGWSINVGGGFHHCSSDSGGGFCAYADITLAIKVQSGK